MAACGIQENSKLNAVCKSGEARPDRASGISRYLDGLVDLVYLDLYSLPDFCSPMKLCRCVVGSD